MLQINNLTGFGVASRGGGLILTRVSTTASTGSTITIPVDSRVSGHLAVLYQYSRKSGSAPSAITPSGFTNIITSTGSTSRGLCGMKILDGTETSLSGMSASADAKHLFIYSGGFASVAAFDAAAQETSGNPASQTVNATTSDGTKPVLIVGAAHATNGANFTIYSPSADQSSSTGEGTAAVKAYQIGDVLFDHVIDMGDNGSRNHLMSCYLELS